jgi:putative salt-induced outer membrane protein
VRRFVLSGCLAFATITLASQASAEAPAPPTGAPPPEAKPIVEAPKGPAEAPTIERKLDGTTASVSAGGMLTSGNSRNLALSANGNVETRFHDNGIGASLLGNYGRGAPPGESVRVTTENLQGRIRYDRYVMEPLAVFLLNTGRHDRFQGLDFRYNLDPGVKYLVLPEATNLLWAELGYDLQYDIRRDADRIVTDASGNLVQLDKTMTDHSSRLFVGYKRGFNKEVTLAAGVEYLQSFVDLDRARLNVDALVAAKLVGGLTFGFGFSARYDNLPLSGKSKLDTASTLSLVYGWSDVPAAR